MFESNQGAPNQQPGTIVVADPPAGSPVILSLAVQAHAVVLAATGKKVREHQIRQAIEGDDLSSKLPNPVRLNPDPAILLNRRFFSDAMLETRDRKGLLVAGDDANTFEFLPLETLKTEASDLYDAIKPELDATDQTKQLLLLTSRPFHLPEIRDGQKVRVPYHVLRMNLDRASVVLKGVPLDLKAGKSPAPQPEPAKVEA